MDPRTADTVRFAPAATLAERLTAGRPDPLPAEPDAGPAQLAGARRRLARWQARAPFTDPRWWHTRLAADGLDEPALLALLAEPAPALAGRLAGGAGRPGWIDDIVADLLTEQPTEPDPASCAGLPFTPAVGGLLALTRARLAARLDALAAAHPDRLDPAAVLADLYRPLPPIVNAMLSRTLVLEANIARVRGELHRDTPAGRFAEFIARYQPVAGRRELFGQYPVLARQLSTLARAWVAAAGSLVERLLTDWDDIAASILGGVDPGRVTAIACGLGDRHRGARTVARVSWSGGHDVIYKPRPMGVDAHFQQLLGWLNERGVQAPFRQLRVLDRGGYGWVEFVRTERAADEAARQRFYRRHGGLLAALYLLRGTDVHAENVLAAGDQPVMVDLESLVQPALPMDLSALAEAEVTVGEIASGSVLTVGLLPERDWFGAAGAGLDLSGLGHQPGQRTPHGLPVIDGVGTDAMQVRLEHIELDLPAHRPVDDDAPLDLLAYTPQIAAGFAEVYQLFLRHRADLAAPGGPVAAFAADEVRVIRAPTLWYGTVLQTGFHPDVLRDGLARERHLDALWRTVETSAGTASCIAAERADLWANDIPVFAARADGTVLHDSAGQPVPGVRLVPGIERVRQRLGQLGPTDLERQLWLIRGALGTTAITLDRRTLLTYRQGVPRQPPPPGDPAGAPDPGPLLATAARIGAHLRRLAFEASDSIQWLGVNSVRGGNWSLGPLMPDLFHGLSGAALFYAWLGELTSDRGSTAVARKAVRTIGSQLDRQALATEGGMAGIGGVLYTLAVLGELWADEALPAQAAARLDEHAAVLSADTGYDFVSGSAGSIAALLTLYRISPQDRVLDHIATAAKRLDATRVDDPDGAGWLSETIRGLGGADRPTAGFSHGVGGIAWTLFEAGRLLGDARYTELARRALRYEQARFQPAEGYWRDERNYRNLDISPDDPPDVGWCYGAMGIGLSRLLCLPHVPADPLIHREIGAALAATQAEPLGLSHCLCHGDLGNLELFLQAASVLRDPRWAAEAHRRAAGVRAGIDRDGWRCGTPLGVETPSLMVGLTGIGYGLLRAARPDRVPAVLAMR